MNKDKSQYYQRGNVLFLILVAVALFAALSYAVTSSARGGGGVAKETAKANAAALIQFGTSVRHAVMKLKTMGYCTESTFGFDTPAYTRYDSSLLNSANNQAPANGICNIYDVRGGNVMPFVPPVSAVDIPDSPAATTPKPGHFGVRTFQVTGIGTDGAAGLPSANDLVLTLNVNRQTCIAINDLGNVENPGGEPPVRIWSGSSGSYTNGSFAATAIKTMPVTGQPYFCEANAVPATSHQYNYVVLER